MQITIIEESDLHKWEEYLRIFSVSPFLAVPWLESFKNPTRTPIYLRFISEENTVGIAAGLSVEPSHDLLKKIHRILYFFSGPAVIDPDKELVKQCIAELIHFAIRNKYTHVIIKYRDYPYVIDFSNMPFRREIREEYIIDLRGEFSDIQKRMRRMIRQNVRKAMRNGLTFHESFSPERIPDLVSLLEETRSIRLSKGYENYSYYYLPYLNEEIISKLLMNKIARIFYIKEKDNILCAQLIIAYGQRAYGLIMGSNYRGYELGANALIWYSGIEQFHKEGYETFNLGGVPEDSSKSGLIFFKTSMGAEKHLCSGGSTPHLNSPFFDLLTNMYRKMPEKKIKQIITRFITGGSG